jgi:hypothetical protein
LELGHLLLVLLVWVIVWSGEDERDRFGREVAPPDEPLVSLKGVGLSSRLMLVAVASSRADGQRTLRSLSALGAHVVGWQLSRLLRSFVGLRRPDEWRSLPGQDRWRGARWA